MEVSEEVVKVVWVGYHDAVLGLFSINQSIFKWLKFLRLQILKTSYSPIFLRVVVTTLKNFLALMIFLVRVFLLHIITEDSLVHHRVENLFFPTVIAAAVALKGATLFVLADKLTGLPLFTGFKGVVFEEVGLTAEILPVMRVDTLGFVVLCVVGTPLRFKVEHEEVLVAGHFVDQWRLDILVRMRKGAILLVVTLLN